MNIFHPCNIPLTITQPIITYMTEIWNTRHKQSIDSSTINTLYIEPKFENDSYSQLFKYLFEEYHLIISSSVLFVTAPNTLKFPHVDGVEGKFVKFALNIPILYCNNTSMVWFLDIDDDKIKKGTLKKNDGSLIGNYHQLKDIGADDFDNIPQENKLQLLSPYFVNTELFHGIDNRMNDNYRVILSFRFKGNPEFPQVYK